MFDKKISRRNILGGTGLALLGAMSGFGFKDTGVSDLSTGKFHPTEKLPFRISLNTSTLSAYQLNVEEQIDLVAAAGFNGIELWVRDVEAYLKEGGSCEAIAQKLKAKNLVLENMIGFAPWFGEDLNDRKKGIDQLQREMDMTAKMGGKYIAAPIMGIKSLDRARLDDYAKRYRAILNLSTQTGVVPILELWGAGALNQLSDGAHMAIGSGHPQATLLLDFYHVYRGGNAWETVDLINCSKLPVMHINDYPASPAREQLTDADRVFPGDGVCPFGEVIPKLYQAGFRGAFSVELFNKTYWDSMDAQMILKKSYEKTHSVLKKAMASVK